ncbi:MAG: hypothetical protein ACOC3C_07830, partial [Candidatus Thorarchaeota archaeon]
FSKYPAYRNIFTKVENRGNLVIMIGHSECSVDVLDGPSIWTAKIRCDQVAEWRVYDDIKENRRKLGIL